MNPENNNMNIPDGTQGPLPDLGQPMPNSPQDFSSYQPPFNPATAATPGIPGIPNVQPNIPLAEPTSDRTRSGLNVPVMSPTHFDQLPASPIIPDSSENDKNSPEHVAKRSTTLAIVTSVLAVIFLICAVVGLVLAVGKNDALETANAELESKSAIVAALETTAGKSIKSPDDIPVFQTTHGYIYISEWGIKIKIPDQLTSISYILDQKYRPSICFNAIKNSATTFPAFADVAQNPGGMGCLTRVAVSEGNADKEGRSFGLLVKTIDDYNYFYTDPARVFSQEPAEQGIEQESAQLIKSMLVDGVSSY